MALNDIERARFEKSVRSYIERRRPPPHIRPQLDLSYRVENQSVVIFEVRPDWKDPQRKIEHNVAKATYIKSRQIWRVYWQRADLKWHSYEPNATVSTIDDFLAVVEADEFGCFYG